MENDVLNMPSASGRRNTLVSPMSPDLSTGLPASGATAIPSQNARPEGERRSDGHVSNATTSRASTTMPPPTQPSHASHNRSKSMAVSAAAARRATNRLSLSFPVQPPTAPARYVAASPSTTIQSSLPTPTTPAQSFASSALPSPTDSANFLVLLASQERRVLELKEELARAEADLDKLKRSWGQQEAVRKKNEVRQVEQLHILRPGSETPRTSMDAPSVSRQSLDQDRRGVVANGNGGPVRAPQRTAIAGQRHTRTLSLLEPGRTNLRPARGEVSPIHGTSTEPPNARSSQPGTTNSRNNSTSSTQARHSLTSSRNPQDAILRTGRQMAEDLKDGLWTFIEDLRQATVGDEALADPSQAGVKTRAARKQGSKGSLRSNGSRSPLTKAQSNSTLRPSASSKQDCASHPSKKNEDIAAEFWESYGDKPASAVPSKMTNGVRPKSMIAPLSPAVFAVEDDDAWSAWGDMSPGISRPDSAVQDKSTASSPSVQRTTSPSPRWSSSTAISDDDLSPVKGTADQNTSKVDASHQIDGIPKRNGSQKKKREEIPWPQLQKLSPGHLKRTASNLMTEWERSLTPPAEKQK